MSAKANIDIVLSNGDKAGKTINELTWQAKDLAVELKKLDTNSADFVQKSEDFKKISGRLKDVKKEAFDTAKAQDLLNSTFGDMIPFQGEFSKLAGGVKGVGAALRATSSMAQLLKVALASTGIGLIVVALGSLVAWLSKTQKGMDFVGKVTAAAGAAFQVIIDRAISFAGALGNLARGKFGAAIDDLKNTFSGLGEEMKEETSAAYEMAGALQDIARQEKDLEVLRSDSRASIEKLKMAAEDQTKSESDRLKAAQEAFEKEQDLLNQSISLQEKKLELTKAQNAQGTSLDSDIDREKDIQIEINNLREESSTKQTELQNKINELKRSSSDKEKALIDGIAAKQKEAADEKLRIAEEAAKAEEELIKKLLEAEKTLQDLRVAAIADEQDQKIAQLLLGYEREMAAFAGSEEQKKEFALLKQAELDASMTAVEEEFAKKRQEKALADLDAANEIKEARIWEQFYSGQITEEERRQIQFEQEKSAIEQRLALLAAAGNTETAQYQELYTSLAQLHYQYNQDKLQSDKEYADAKFQLEQMSLAATSETFNAIIGFLERDEKAKKKNFAVIKALRLAEVTTNSIAEIQAIWKAAQENPLNSIFPGAAQVIAGVKTAAAVIRYGTAVNKITQTKFAKGGPVFGPSHQAGGIKFAVGGQVNEMEGGEIILTKGVYQNPSLREAASRLNVLGGGRSFALGGPVIRDRPMVSPSSGGSLSTTAAAIANESAGSQMDLSKTNQLLELIAQFTMRSAEKPPVVMTEIEAKLNELQNLRVDARN